MHPSISKVRMIMHPAQHSRQELPHPMFIDWMAAQVPYPTGHPRCEPQPFVHPAWNTAHQIMQPTQHPRRGYWPPDQHVKVGPGGKFELASEAGVCSANDLPKVCIRGTASRASEVGHVAIPAPDMHVHQRTNSHAFDHSAVNSVIRALIPSRCMKRPRQPYSSKPSMPYLFHL